MLLFTENARPRFIDISSNVLAARSGSCSTTACAALWGDPDVGPAAEVVAPVAARRQHEATITVLKASHRNGVGATRLGQ
jgi:hypothetical protein